MLVALLTFIAVAFGVPLVLKLLDEKRRAASAEASFIALKTAGKSHSFFDEGRNPVRVDSVHCEAISRLAVHVIGAAPSMALPRLEALLPSDAKGLKPTECLAEFDLMINVDGAWVSVLDAPIAITQSMVGRTIDFTNRVRFTGRSLKRFIEEKPVYIQRKYFTTNALPNSLILWTQ